MINTISKPVKLISYVIYVLSGHGIHQHSKKYFPNIGYQLEFSDSTLGEQDRDFALQICIWNL